MKRIINLFLFGILFCLLGLNNSFAAVYWVSPGGDNSNPGTMDKPWKTVGFGSKQLKPGDTLIIKQGVYNLREFDADMITPRESGTASAWITIKGQDPENRPILKGSGSLFAAIDISGKSYIRIENLEITSNIDNPYTGGLREGIDAGGSGGGDVSHIEIRNVLIHHVEETGINVSGNASHLRFEGVHIHHTGMTALGSPSANGGNGWQNVVIYRCTFEYAGNFYHGQEQISPYDRPDGFGIEDSQGPVEIAYTRSQYNLGDGLDSKAKNTYIHHCIVANNFGDGVKLWGSGSKVENTLIYGTGYPRPDVQTPWTLLIIESDDRGGDFEIVNNTLFDDSSRPAHYSMVVQYDNCPTNPINLTLRNNIIAGLKRSFIGGCVNLDAKNNLFFNRNETQGVQLEYGNRIFTDISIGTLGPGNKYGDPKFKNGSWGPEGDFHIMSDSPAIDAGSQGVGYTDYEMDPRVWGSSVDIGADEYKPAKTLNTGITINGHSQKGVQHSEYFTINVSLDPGENKQEAEYYLWVIVPELGVYWYQYPWKWVKSDKPLVAYQGDLVKLENFLVFDGRGSQLPLGPYHLYFAVDTTLDGAIDWTSVAIGEMDLYEN